jgi:hypothetical protein
MAVRSSEQVYGPNAIRMTEHCLYFHDQTLEYMASKITKPLINAIQEAVDRSKAKREQGTSLDDLRRKNGLSKVEHIIYELRNSLGEDTPGFQAAANIFANEVIACAISAINRHEAVPTAIVLAEWAAELPAYGQTRKWLLEQRGKIFTWDPDYVSEDDPEDDPADADLQANEEEEKEVKPSPPSSKIPTGTTTCPRCTQQFEPDELVEYTGFGIRCPYCRQSIVL